MTPLPIYLPAVYGLLLLIAVVLSHLLGRK